MWCEAHRLSFLAIVIVLLAATSSHGQATATISADVVSEFESVTLTVTDRNRDSGDPDFSTLETDFEISQVSTSSNIQIVNGRVDSARSWKLELMPKRTGTIDIPPITVGNSHTNRLRLQVNPISARERNYISRTAFFETVISHERQYPQAAIYVTRRMLYTAQARIPSMPQDKQLDISNATVLPIGSRESHQEVRNGIEYFVMQWRYVVFAEKSGTLRVPGENARIAIYGNQFRPQVRPIVAPEKTITILPIPDEYPRDEAWFPASKVELTQTFDPTETSALSLGDAVTRSIDVRARDSYQSALLPLELGSIENLRVYPEQATVDSVLEGNRVWGIQSRTFNLIPVEPGRVVLPEFRLTWWDTESKEVRVTTLPSSSFNVPIPPGSQIAKESDQASTDDSAQPIDSQYGIGRTNLWVYVLAVTAFTGWILAFALIFLNREKYLLRFVRKPLSFQIDYAPIRHALSHGDMRTLRHAILHILAQHLDVSLVDARQLFLETTIGHEILTQLDQLAYSDSTSEFEFDLKTIQQVIDSIVKVNSGSAKEFGLETVLN